MASLMWCEAYWRALRMAFLMVLASLEPWAMTQMPLSGEFIVSVTSPEIEPAVDIWALMLVVVAPALTTTLVAPR